RLAGLPGEPVDDAEAEERAKELRDCEALAAVLRAHGIAVERYEGELGCGLFLPDDARMNPARRALALASRLRAQAELYEHSPVTAIQSGKVVTQDGEIAAPIV